MSDSAFVNQCQTINPKYINYKSDRINVNILSILEASFNNYNNINTPMTPINYINNNNIISAAKVDNKDDLGDLPLLSITNTSSNNDQDKTGSKWFVLIKIKNKVQNYQN